jgi:hypothetical protein
MPEPSTFSVHFNITTQVHVVSGNTLFELGLLAIQEQLRAEKHQQEQQKQKKKHLFKRYEHYYNRTNTHCSIPLPPPLPPITKVIMPLPVPYKAPAHSLLSSLNNPIQYFEYAIQQYRTVAVINPSYLEAICQWGVTLMHLARQFKHDGNSDYEQIYDEAEQRFSQVLQLRYR